MPTYHLNVTHAFTMPLGGMPIVLSELAEDRVPARRHIKTKSCSEQYHKRIQKKWLKRYGWKFTPSCHIVDDLFTGRGKIMVMHPEVYYKMRDLYNEVQP